MAQVETKLRYIPTKEEIAEMRKREKVQIAEERRYKMQKPRMRLPWRIRKGQIIRVWVKLRHPVRTGLRLLRDGTFERSRPEFYIRRIDVFYGSELVSKFELTSAISDDPIFAFHLRADKEAPLRVAFTNHRDERSEVVRMVRFHSG